MGKKKVFNRISLRGLANKAPDAGLDVGDVRIPPSLDEDFDELDALISEKAHAGCIDAGNAGLIMLAYESAAEVAVADILAQASSLELAEALAKASRAHRREQLEGLLDVFESDEAPSSEATEPQRPRDAAWALTPLQQACSPLVLAQVPKGQRQRAGAKRRPALIRGAGQSGANSKTI